MNGSLLGVLPLLYIYISPYAVFVSESLNHLSLEMVQEGQCKKTVEHNDYEALPEDVYTLIPQCAVPKRVQGAESAFGYIYAVPLSVVNKVRCHNSDAYFG